MVTPGRVLRSVSARFHATCGWLSFRLGLRGPARRHYEQVLRLVGDDFSAYVHLGRIAYDAGDYAGWRREFEHARRADPIRFARLRHPFELFEPRLAGATFDDAGERATWRSLRPFGTPQNIAGPVTGGQHANAPFGGRRTGESGEPPPDFERLGSWADSFDGPSPDPTRPPDGDIFPRGQDVDDCTSSAERRRFSELGPIARDEWVGCDIDELARRLGGC